MHTDSTLFPSCACGHLTLPYAYNSLQSCANIAVCSSLIFAFFLFDIMRTIINCKGVPLSEPITKLTYQRLRRCFSYFSSWTSKEPFYASLPLVNEFGFEIRTGYGLFHHQEALVVTNFRQTIFAQPLMSKILKGGQEIEGGFGGDYWWSFVLHRNCVDLRSLSSIFVDQMNTLMLTDFRSWKDLSSWLVFLLNHGIIKTSNQFHSRSL